MRKRSECNRRDFASQAGEQALPSCLSVQSCKVPFLSFLREKFCTSIPPFSAKCKSRRFFTRVWLLMLTLRPYYIRVFNLKNKRVAVDMV